MNKIVLSFFVVMSFSKGFGQTIVPISKTGLENKVIENNLQVKMAKSETELAQSELLASRAMYLPNVTTSYTFTNTNNPLMAFGSKLNQERITMADFNPGNLNSPSAINNFASKIEVQQPIINMDAVYMKKAGQVKVDALKIKSERTQNYVLFELKKAYMMLQLAYKMEETLQNAKNTVIANKSVIDNYFKNGIVQKSEVLYMDVRLSEIESQIQQASSNIKNASDYLFFLLDEDKGNKILKPSDALYFDESKINANDKLNENRKDLLAYKKSLEAYDWMIKSAKSKFLPRLNAFGNFEMHDKSFAGFNANGYLVGLQLSWNVFDGLKSKSEQKKYQSELLKSQLEVALYTKQSQLELDKSKRQILDANTKVLFANKALMQSKEAYRIRKDRYDQGLEKSADLLNAETIMSQKELEYQQAIFEYSVAVEYANFLSH